MPLCKAHAQPPMPPARPPDQRRCPGAERVRLKQRGARRAACQRTSAHTRASASLNRPTADSSARFTTPPCSPCTHEARLRLPCQRISAADARTRRRRAAAAMQAGSSCWQPAAICAHGRAGVRSERCCAAARPRRTSSSLSARNLRTVAAGSACEPVVTADLRTAARRRHARTCSSSSAGPKCGNSAGSFWKTSSPSR
jgi:hypothetical protein